MNKEEYKILVKSKIPKENKLNNALIAFLSGGVIGMSAEILTFLITIIFKLDRQVSMQIVCIILIFSASFLTSLGIFDEFVTKFKCGLIIPTTGFAHSITSASLEYKKDGMITGIGTNFLKLAGSVILYGIVSAFFLCLLKVVFYG